MKTPITIQANPGQPLPLGASVTADGVNFALFSRNATRIWLHLFDNPADGKPSHTFALDPVANRPGDIWHIHLTGVAHEQLYLFQVDGPYQPQQGHRFNRHKPLLDPYAKAISGDFHWDFSQAYGYDPASPDEDESFSTTTNFAGMPKCLVYGQDGFDWQGDRPLNRPFNETIIYETHVRSLTYYPNSQAEHPGTYRGVVEKIPYFLELGVTAIELLPIHLFNEWEFTRYNPVNNERLRNYWGYNTLSFFAPKGHYSHYPSDRGQQVVAFKEMVRELHKAGLEIILDVVFNHTVEGNHLGPTLSFRGIDNAITTCWKTIAAITKITAAWATPWRAATPLCRILSSIACATGCRRCTLMAFGLIWLPASAATNGATYPATRPCPCASPKTRCCARPKSSPSRGTLAVTRWATFPAGAGPSGTTSSAMKSASIGAAMAASMPWLPGWPAAPICTTPIAAPPTTASTLLPPTMALP